MGKSGDTVYTARSKEILAAAYFDICTTFHHFELDKKDTTKTCSTSANTIDISSLSIHGIFEFTLNEISGGAFRRHVEFEEAHFQLAKYRNTAEEPKTYTRYGDEIWFAVLPNAAYKTTIYYYSDPTAPDYGGSPTTPETAREWDDRILELALALGHAAIWSHEQAGFWQERFDRSVAKMTNPLLREIPMHGRPERPTRTEPHGGDQG